MKLTILTGLEEQLTLVWSCKGAYQSAAEPFIGAEYLVTAIVGSGRRMTMSNSIPPFAGKHSDVSAQPVPEAS